MIRLVFALFLVLSFSFGASVTQSTSLFASVDKTNSELGAVVATVKLGDQVKVIEVYSPYVKITSKGVTGWVWIELFEKKSDEIRLKNRNSDGGAMIVSEPNTFKNIGSVGIGENLKILESWNTWVLVETASGAKGWIFITAIKL